MSIERDLTRWTERSLTADEARAWAAPIGDDEREQVLALVRWFTRRYPKALLTACAPLPIDA